MPDPNILDNPAGGQPPAAAAGTPPADGGTPPAAPTPPAGDNPAGNPPSILDGDPATPPVTVQADWPEDWQTKMAGGNEDMLKIIKRYSSPANLAAALVNAQQKIRSGKVVDALPENATEAQVAEYRKALGVPDTADGYKLPEGVVLGDQDKALFKGFFGEMHANHVPASVVEKVVGAYMKNVEAEIERKTQDDLAYHQTSNLTIRKEWGGNYNANINAIKGMLAMHPQEVQENIMGARLANGKKLADDPATLRALLQMAKDINPAATVIPGGMENGKSIEARMAEMQVMMRDQKKWHSKENAPIREEHLQLIKAQQQFAAQGK